MENRACWLTTRDNPYNPFTQFRRWFMYDSLKGYNTCGQIARIAHVSKEMTDIESNSEIESAIDDLLRIDFMKNYEKVYWDEEKDAVYA